MNHKLVFERHCFFRTFSLKKVKQNINTKSDDDEIMNMLKLIKTKVDLNSIQLSELKNTLI